MGEYFSEGSDNRVTPCPLDLSLSLFTLKEFLAADSRNNKQQSQEDRNMIENSFKRDLDNLNSHTTACERDQIMQNIVDARKPMPGNGNGGEPWTKNAPIVRERANDPNHTLELIPPDWGKLGNKKK